MTDVPERMAVFMIEKRIRGFYNSVQITGEFSKESAARIGRFRLIARACFGLAAAVLLAKAVMCLADAVGQRAAGDAEE